MTPDSIAARSSHARAAGPAGPVIGRRRMSRATGREPRRSASRVQYSASARSGGSAGGERHGKMGAVTWKAPDVERPQGPLTGPERPMLQAFLDWHRATLLYKCAGLPGAQLAERTVPPSGLSLRGLIRHMTKV